MVVLLLLMFVQSGVTMGDVLIPMFYLPCSPLIHGLMSLFLHVALVCLILSNQGESTLHKAADLNSGNSVNHAKIVLI